MIYKKNLKDILILFLFMALFSGCGGRKINQEEPTNAPSLDSKNDQDAQTISRLQARIEELDAKLSSLSDRLDAAHLQIEQAKLHPSVQSQTEAPIPVVDLTKKSEPTDIIENTKQNNSAPDTVIDEFQKAMQFFKAGQYAESELAFHRFAENYRSHILAGSAQFYAGESYYLMNEYKLAINEYNRVITAFESSPRVASAMVRISQSHQALGETNQATQIATVAQNLFSGNPSLDWLTHKTDHSKLSVSPIEPSQETINNHAETETH